MRSLLLLSCLVLVACVCVSASPAGGVSLQPASLSSASASAVAAAASPRSAPMVKLQSKVDVSGDKDGKKDQKKKDKKWKKVVTAMVDSAADKPVVAAGGTGGPVFSCIIETLHPTQFAVGYEAVKAKRATIQKRKKKDEFEAYLLEKPIPVVVGPGDKLFLIDHHHLSRALFEEKIKYGLCTKLADWSAKTEAQFWKDMEAKAWVFMKNENGVPIQYQDIPNHVGKLADNPYRSLAGFVRDAGGFSKTSIPFTEFYWADHFRKLVPLAEVTGNFQKAVQKAIGLAQLPAAKGLPGYSAAPAVVPAKKK